MPAGYPPRYRQGAMWGLDRWLRAACVALLAAGAAGAVTHRSPAGHTDAAGRSASSPAAGSAPATSLPSGPVPGSAALASGMITPAEMGGHYRADAGQAAAVLDSAPCLAGLQPSARQAGRAATALLGPDPHAVPTIVELAASYPGSEAGAVYQDVVAAVGACPAFDFAFGGSPVSVPLTPGTIPPVGVADQVWSGDFTYSGSPLRLQVAVVLDGQTVLALLWVDSVPPAAAVPGGFTSTLSAALGKLA